MMHYSYILCLVLMTNLSLSAASSGSYPNDHQRSSYDEVPGSEIVNIGNGVNRKNYVVIDEKPDNVGAPYENTRSRSQTDPLGYKHDTNSRSWESTINIGNGRDNRNTVVIGSSDRGSSFSEQNNPNVGNTGGTSFVLNRNNGVDNIHVGYGTNNQNKISVDGKPVELDCYGMCDDDVKETPRISGAAKTNQAISLFLSFLSLFYLILI